MFVLQCDSYEITCQSCYGWNLGWTGAFPTLVICQVMMPHCHHINWERTKDTGSAQQTCPWPSYILSRMDKLFKPQNKGPRVVSTATYICRHVGFSLKYRGNMENVLPYRLAQLGMSRNESIFHYSYLAWDANLTQDVPTHTVRFDLLLWHPYIPTFNLYFTLLNWCKIRLKSGNIRMCLFCECARER